MAMTTRMREQALTRWCELATQVGRLGLAIALLPPPGAPDALASAREEDAFWSTVGRCVQAEALTEEALLVLRPHVSQRITSCAPAHRAGRRRFARLLGGG